MPELEFAFETRAEVGPLIDLGPGPQGHRRLVPITGGSFEGPGLRGRVLPGADWQVLRPDGVLELEARYAFETDDSALITIVNRGLRAATPEVMARLNRGERVDKDDAYFRTSPQFETAAPAYLWLTRALFVGYGERLPDAVLIQFWKVL